ncbi:MAG: S41 family peptidase [Lutimonas sp.]
MKTFFLVLALSFVVMNNHAQEKLNETLLIEDFSVLKTITCEIAPSLTAEEKQELYNQFDKEAKELIGRSMSVIEFFNFLISNHTQTKLDGHGSLSIPNDIMVSLLGNEKVLFPIPILIINDQFVVNTEMAEIPFGSVIKEVNGVPVSTMINQFIYENSTFQLRTLERSFDLLYFIKYGAPESFRIKFQYPNTTELQEINLSPLDVQLRTKVYDKTIYPLNREKLRNTVNHAFDKSTETYVIQLNSFNWIEEKLENDYGVFQDKFDQLFKDIKKQKAKNLIIDLRFNMGGNSFIPGLFYSYIALGDFKEEIYVRVSDFEFPHKEYITKIDGDDVNQRQIGEIIEYSKKVFTKNDEYFEFTPVNATIHPNKKSFMGDVYLLVGGRTFSASAYFTALFKQEKRGVMIGEKVGGSHQNVTAGKLIQYTLPNSKIEVVLPIGIIKYVKELEINIPEKNIIPDILVGENLKYQYLLKKEDWDLREAIKFIGK